MSFVSRWTQSISRAGRDGMSLSRAVYCAVLPGKRSHPTSLATATNASLGEKVKSVLLQEARREPAPNSMAISMLKIDKEIGLVKYWGLAEYLRQNQSLFSFSSISARLMNPKMDPTSSDGNSNDTVDSTSTGGVGDAAQNPTNSASTARIAFMITSSMKRDLVDGLGYHATDVKGMTPQQASLVLHHRLTPESYENEISKLEKEFEEEQEKRQQEQQQELQKLESSSKENEQAESKLSPESTSSGIGISESLVESSEERSGKNTLLIESSVSHEISEAPSLSTAQQSALNGVEIEGDIDLWYEVVEIQEDGVEKNEIRHGLYKDRDEAVLGLEARQDIHNKRQQEANIVKNNRSEGESKDNQQISFVLRPISGKDVQ